VHPVIQQHGWHYAECSVWDKGKTHIAGNVNSKTIRGLPVTTEVCCRYTRTSLAVVPNVTDTTGKTLPANAWLRAEWQRTGLPLRETNAACGVRDAATRKYFTTEADLWYPPPEKRMEKLRQYVAEYGDAAGAPYFSLSVQDTRAVWSRAKWNHQHGLTNVWSAPPVRGAERIKRHGKTLHPNQKPLRLMEQLLLLSSDSGDVVWEPFGGLCTAAVAAQRVGRECYCAEVNQCYWEAAAARLKGDIVPETPKLPKRLGLWGDTRR